MTFAQLHKARALVTAVTLSLMLTACSQDDPVQQTKQFLERAIAYQDQGQYKASMIEYRNAIKQSSDPDGALLKYGTMLNDMGRFGAAQDVLSQVKDSDDAAVVLERVRSHIGIGKFRSAKELLDTLSPSGTPEFADLIRLYLAKVDAGQFELVRAEKEYLKLLGSSDTNVASEARVALAKVQASQKNYSDAMANVDKLGKGDPSYIEAQVVKASLLIVQGEMEQAETVLTEALSELPNTDIMLPEKAVVLERLSYVLTRLGRSNEAFIYQKLLAEAFPGANDLSEKYQEALSAFQNKDYLSAKATLQGILNDYPLYQKGKQLLGIIQYLEGDTSSASQLLSDSVDPEIADPVTRHIYAATNLKLDDPKKVIEILEPELETTEVPETLVLYALAAISDGQLSKGEAAMLRAAKLSPEDAKIRLTLANYYRQSGKVDEEFEQLQTALQLDSSEKQVLAGLVSFYVRNEGVARAERFVKETLDQNPDYYATNLISGYFYAATGRVESSLPYFNKALETKRSDAEKIEALLAKGRVELLLSQHKAAESSFQSVIKLDPKNESAYAGLLEKFRRTDASDAEKKIEAYAQRDAVIEPYFVLIQDSLQRRDLVETARYLDAARALELSPGRVAEFDQSLRFARALEAMNSGSFNDARSLVTGLLGEKDGNIRLLSLLVEIELRDGKTQEAEKVFAQIETIDANHPVVAMLRSDIAVAKGDFGAAKDLLQREWTSKPSEVVADKLFGLYSRMGDNKARAQHIEEWSKAFPNSPKPMLLKAIAFQQRGQRIKAIELYEKFLSIIPNDVTGLNNLGWIYFEKGDSRAVPMLEKAVELAPNNPEVLDSLGWVLFKTGQIEKGRDYLKRAVDLAPDNAAIKAHYEESLK